MTEKARDVSALFEALNITESYREFQPTESATNALERWPLLRSLEPLPEVKPVDSPDALREFLFGGGALQPPPRLAPQPQARPLNSEALFGENRQRRASDGAASAPGRRATDQYPGDPSVTPLRPVPMPAPEAASRPEAESGIAFFRPSRADEPRRRAAPLFQQPAPEPPPVQPQQEPARTRALGQIFNQLEDGKPLGPLTAPAPSAGDAPPARAPLSSLFGKLR